MSSSVNLEGEQMINLLTNNSHINITAEEDIFIKTGGSGNDHTFTVNSRQFVLSGEEGGSYSSTTDVFAVKGVGVNLFTVDSDGGITASSISLAGGGSGNNIIDWENLEVAGFDLTTTTNKITATSEKGMLLSTGAGVASKRLELYAGNSGAIDLVGKSKVLLSGPRVLPLPFREMFPLVTSYKFKTKMAGLMQTE